MSTTTATTCTDPPCVARTQTQPARCSPLKGAETVFSLTALIRRAAQINPNVIATEDAERQTLWQDFPERIARLAGGMQQLGVTTGERAAILALNSDRYYEFYFAVAWAGGVFVPVNTRLAAPEVIHWLTDSGTRVLCVDDAFLPLVAQLRAEVPTIEHVVYLGDDPDANLTRWDKLAEAKAVADAGRCNDDLAGLFYTGGTTGRSKGVMLSHSNLVVNALQAAPVLQMQPGDRILHTAPMFHIADWCMCVGAAIVAGSNYFLPGFEPVQVMRSVARQRIQKMLMVPTMINMVVHHPDLSQHDLSSLETVMYGASPMPEAVIERALEALPHTRLCQAYGQTEAAPILTMLRPEYHTVDTQSACHGKLKSAGQAVPGVELAILDSDDQPVAPGEVGEVCARGPNVMLGYRNLDEQTAMTLKHGWLHTGDGGRMDEDGFLYIVDRVKDMIISGGENVYSAEVENILFQHPAVSQCAVIGVPDEKWGERVHAIVVVKEGADADESDLIAHCKAAIAGYKCPRSVSFRKAPLPLSGAGKILKTELRKPFWEGQERNVG
ncbi:MAG: long-chain-fatty-acid--CoA ligase [Gammaproteobacteria bacterium]|nr:long-chain-fatty-acid--CoA ligase [Gammaproteobacteria bacterium]